MPPATDIERLRAVLSRLEPDWDLARLRNLAPLAGGYANENFAFDYEGQGYVLRIVRPGLPGPIPRELELAVLGSGISTHCAPVVGFLLPEGHLLSRRVEGPLLVDCPPSCAALADYLVTLHARLPAFEHVHALDRLILLWFDIAESGAGRVDRRWRPLLASLPPTTYIAPCHNDLNPWNIVVRGATPRDWCTLDWEWCGRNDPFFDIVTLVRGLGLTDAAEDEVVGLYCDQQGTAAPASERLRSLRVRYFLRECAWALAATATWGARSEFEDQIRRSAERLAEFLP